MKNQKQVPKSVKANKVTYKEGNDADQVFMMNYSIFMSAFKEKIPLAAAAAASSNHKSEIKSALTRIMDGINSSFELFSSKLN